MSRRGCFASHEFSENNSICKACEDFIECKMLAPKKKPYQKVKKWGKRGEWY